MKKKIVLAGCIMAMAMVFTGCGKKTESSVPGNRRKSEY